MNREKLCHNCYERKPVVEVDNKMYIIGICFDCGCKRPVRIKLEKLGFNIPHILDAWRAKWQEAPVAQPVPVRKKKKKAKKSAKKKGARK